MIRQNIFRQIFEKSASVKISHYTVTHTSINNRLSSVFNTFDIIMEY